MVWLKPIEVHLQWVGARFGPRSGQGKGGRQERSERDQEQEEHVGHLARARSAPSDMEDGDQAAPEGSTADGEMDEVAVEARSAFTLGRTFLRKTMWDAAVCDQRKGLTDRKPAGLTCTPHCVFVGPSGASPTSKSPANGDCPAARAASPAREWHRDPWISTRTLR